MKFEVHIPWGDMGGEQGCHFPLCLPPTPWTWILKIAENGTPLLKGRGHVGGPQQWASTVGLNGSFSFPVS